MARDVPASSSTRAQAHRVFVRLVLPPYTIHFKSPTYFQPATLDLLDKKICKETLKSTASSGNVREAIGGDAQFWKELVALLRAAIPSLERRSFTEWDPSSVDYESTTGAVIAGNYPGLWKDVERLNDVVSISRNLLTIGAQAQDLAAEQAVDTQVFRLINVCVRVTARGYDGQAGTGEEEKWQWVVNGYKKLLITSLQFLNNLVAQNERRKVMLWVNLFDSGMDSITETGAHQSEEQRQRQQQQVEEKARQQQEQKDITPLPQEKANKTEPPINTNDILLAYGTTGPQQRLSPLELEAAQPIDPTEGFKPIPAQAKKVLDKKRYEPNAWVYFVHYAKETCVTDFQKQHNRAPMLGEISKNLPRYWYAKMLEERRSEKVMWNVWQGKYGEALERYRRELEGQQQGSAPKALPPPPPPPKPAPKREMSIDQEKKALANDEKSVEAKIRLLEEQLAERYRASASNSGDPSAPINLYGSNAPRHIEPDDYNPLKPANDDEKNDLRMLFTADAGAKILESGKIELMKRLEGEASYHHAHNAGSIGSENHSGDARAPDASTYHEIARARQMSHSRRRSSLASPKVRQTAEHLSGRRQWLGNVDDSFEPDESLDDEDEEEDDIEDEEEEDDDEDDEDEDYPGSTEDGRGLLTDVPLILGPSEIEVLPMLIMSGIVMPPPPENKPWLYDGTHLPPPWAPPEEKWEGQAKLRNAHTLRTHLLLSQTSGRNLLRELLIFVAAWDLREEELYFKFMVKIMESILKNGLMPYAYHAFRDRSRSKDIISPAQAVIMKLLTCIFRQRSETAKTDIATAVTQADLAIAAGQGARWLATRNGTLPYPLFLARHIHSPTRVDLQVLNFIFTEFRQHIIPQTCALIFLQGQIHRGRAEREDFPLNLWDMERMYEGVYQFLEFFAVLTEEQQGSTLLPAGHDRAIVRKNGEEAPEEVKENIGAEEFSWKKILAEWEMASELVTLLRELEGGIPKLGEFPPAEQMTKRIAAQAPANGLQSAPQRSLSADAVTGQAPVAVERPFDLDAPDSTLPPLPLQPLPSTGQQIFEPETPLAYPEDPNLSAHDLQHDQDEPSDFEWRNLKKLTVLVLSSLLWKNKTVQDQVRACGGLEALVGCCRQDEHNPYIREHAIMCLRFAVEGCEENSEVIRRMAEQKKIPAQPAGHVAGGGGGGRGGGMDVPREVLDTNGYETFMDGKGQVGLRRKDTASAPPSSTASNYVPGAPPYGPGAPVIPSSSTTTNTTISSSSKPPLGPPTATTATNTTVAGRKIAAASGSGTKMTAEKAAELMQNALRDLPLGDKLVTDKQKAEALARLDRAFESTEMALGRTGAGGGGEGKGKGS